MKSSLRFGTKFDAQWLGALGREDFRRRRHGLIEEISMARKYSKGASKDVKRAMRKRKKGTLKSGGSGKKVKSRKQAIAIGLSEAREKGKKVPKKKRL
jgi:hypothetical protein